MNILITGITGNVGYYCYEALKNYQDVNIIGAVRNIEKAKRVINNVELRPLDFLNSSTFETCLEGIDKIFLVRPPQISDVTKINHFIDVAVNMQVTHIVFLSLMGIEKNPFPPHRKIEKHLKEHCHYTFLRPSFFMQNLLETHLEDIKKNNDLFIPSGKAKLSFIDCEDIGEVGAKCLLNDEHLDRAYTLTGPVALNYYKVADLLTEVLDKEITYSKPSLFKFRREMLKRGYKKDYVNVMVMLNIMTRLNTASKVTNDVEKILGRKPHTLKQFVNENKEKFLRR